jgi:hypothetical protein
MQHSTDLVLLLILASFAGLFVTGTVWPVCRLAAVGHAGAKARERLT